MQITEPGSLGPDFERRLKAVLERITPPTPNFADARYRSLVPATSGGFRRLAPALVAIAAIVVMAISATAATGSTNPQVWGQRAASSIKSISHIPQAKPASHQSPKPSPAHESPSGQQSMPGRSTSSPSRETEPSPEPEPTDRPEPSPQPGHSPEPYESPEPSPSPEPSHGDGHTWSPDASPSPDDHSHH